MSKAYIDVMVFWVCSAASAAAGNVCICVGNNFAMCTVCALAGWPNKACAALEQHVTINLVSVAVVGL